MGFITEMLRSLFGRCPICGGSLTIIEHDCMRGDLVKCNWCGKKWRVQ